MKTQTSSLEGQSWTATPPGAAIGRPWHPKCVGPKGGDSACVGGAGDGNRGPKSLSPAELQCSRPVMGRPPGCSASPPVTEALPAPACTPEAW